MQQITFIGGGNMARSLVSGLVKARHGGTGIHVADPGTDKLARMEKEFGITPHADNREAVAHADVIVLAVEPGIVAHVCREIGPVLEANGPLIVSIAAGIRTDQIQTWLNHSAAVVRVMPNTPALIGAGACGMVATTQVTPEQKQAAQTILEASGICEWLDDEALMDTVTAISGSAPAYFFLLVEALENAAVDHGLPREAARHLAAQTCLGAGRMLIESGESPAHLRERVTTPNGTTAAALGSFNDDGFRAIVANAVDAARRRGLEMAASGND